MAENKANIKALKEIMRHTYKNHYEILPLRRFPD
jgi:hypothetical protein